MSTSLSFARIAVNALASPGSNWIAREALELAEHQLAPQRAAVGAVAAHRVERVDDRDDARGERDLLPESPSG